MASDKASEPSYDIACPECKTTKYRNPHMKLKVNVCGHALCENCVNVIFVKESAVCPEPSCDEILKKSKFRLQIFEDPIVEKEIDIRRKIMRIYNRLEEDFATPEEYDDYLEEVESIVYSCAHDINRHQTEAKVEAYERANKEAIKKNWGRKGEANEHIDRLIEKEKQASEQRLKEQQSELEKRKKPRHTQETLLKDLMSHEGDASLIVKTFKEKLRKEEEEAEEAAAPPPLLPGLTEFSSGVRIGAGAGSAPPPPVAIEAAPYAYTAPVLPAHLPLPSATALKEGGYLRHVRAANVVARAGGYTETIAAMRALHDLMAGHALPAKA